MGLVLLEKRLTNSNLKGVKESLILDDFLGITLSGNDSNDIDCMGDEALTKKGVFL